MVLQRSGLDHLIHGPRNQRAVEQEMHIWTQLGSWLARRGASRCGLTQPAFTDCDDELPVEPERPWGCGWFDSSIDLRQGLAVIEHQRIDLGLALDMMLMPDTGRP